MSWRSAQSTFLQFPLHSSMLDSCRSTINKNVFMVELACSFAVLAASSAPLDALS